jgi:cytochrome c-type biogenesis protein CcmE
MATMNSRRWALVAVAGIVAAFGWLMYGGLDKNVVYFWTPKELLAKGDAAYERPVRLGGQVKAGTVKWDEKTMDLRFTITDVDGVSDVVVHSKGAPPQMFRDAMGVVVEGRYGRDNVFQSSSLMIKHSNEYKAPKPGTSGKDMVKTLMQGNSTT